MNTTKVIHQAKLTNWAELIREQKASGMNVTKFCEARSISKSQFTTGGVASLSSL